MLDTFKEATTTSMLYFKPISRPERTQATPLFLTNPNQCSPNKESTALALE
jgi:hypothetical protein